MGNIVTQILCASQEAVKVAEQAFASWQFVPPARKAAIFRRAAELIQSDKYIDKIVHAAVEETGSVPWRAKTVNINIAVGSLYEAADAVYAIKGEMIPSDFGARSFLQKVPMGVMYVHLYSSYQDNLMKSVDSSRLRGMCLWACPYCLPLPLLQQGTL